ncbi:hypothetical protein BN1356_00940 [Streptococcus varani]|uniref:Uncharacterized protein n=1 Tax=Streptococcus varani TaxID=1608583 RepID=A0A0E4H464_9STRE|nr:hypothetical protein [Streptococcus varani]CQR24596.1 hypothetical protein BN1356_00940 [Streptococcus varani]
MNKQEALKKLESYKVTTAFADWVGHSLGLAQCEMFIYLLFGNEEEKDD